MSMHSLKGFINNESGSTVRELASERGHRIKTIEHTISIIQDEKKTV